VWRWRTELRSNARFLQPGDVLRLEMRDLRSGTVLGGQQSRNYRILSVFGNSCASCGPSPFSNNFTDVKFLIDFCGSAGR